MADLGPIGVAAGTGAVSCKFDIAAGWDITANPIRCHEISGTYRALPKREDWKIVSGVVTDAAGLPAARTVRAIDRANGVVLGTTTSDAVTGAYAIAVPVSSEIQRIVLDDDAGTLYNDLIDRVLLP